jgi:hypothetical protein
MFETNVLGAYFVSLNYQQIQPQVREMGEKEEVRAKHLKKRQEKAEGILESRADDLERLRAKVERAAAENGGLRSAIPLTEPLTAHDPSPDVPPGVTVLAVDGSQINPDRDAPADYYLINIGGIVLDLEQPTAPETFVESRLRYGDQMYTKTGRVTNGFVSLQRDLFERKSVATWAEQIRAEAPAEQELVTLTDGPLELWGAGDPDMGREFDQYLESLQRLMRSRGIPAGYVDKPQADLVVRLLEIARLEENRLAQARDARVFRGVMDVDLFRSRLAPGERSAVFGIQSKTRDRYPEPLQLCFFYVNMGSQERPGLARVEVPAYLAEDRERLGLLHAVLVQQSRVFGEMGYPYLIHRAHEIAVVTREENDLLTSMIQQERRRHQLPAGNISRKKFLKDQPGRRRYS